MLYVRIRIPLCAFRGNLRDGTKKRCSRLGYQLLLAVELISEELAEVAIEAAGVTGTVDQLVKERGVVVSSVYKPKAGGKMNGIGAWTIVSSALCLDLGADRGPSCPI